MDSTTIYSAVKDRYTATVRAPSNPSYSNTVAQAFGYSASDLSSIPSEANLGVSCGNPLALANLKQGETVVDLGCGAGFDCFLAARKVGDEGMVIGVDMNEVRHLISHHDVKYAVLRCGQDMLSKARLNASRASITNTTFLSALITSIPLSNSTADVVISNCVINLVPVAEKPLVFKEIYRLLKPGGRLAISDILIKKDLSEQMKNDLALYVGCVAGASKKEEYEEWLVDAGFGEVVVVDAGVDLNVYTQTDGEDDVGGSCCGPAYDEETADTRELEEKNGGCCSGG